MYSAYGLAIKSDIELPALAHIEPTEPDITIAAATIPADAGGKTKFRNWEAEPERFLSSFFGIGRFLITGGDTIHYDRDAGADDTQIISIILGTALAAAMMQRRILPIHSCSVMTDQGAVLVMGRSGAGKSTMLGGLLALDLPMLADDVTGLDFDNNGQPVAIPGFPAMRLWEDSLTKLGHSTDGLPQVRSDIRKYYVPVENFHTTRARIRAIVHLTVSNETNVRIEPLGDAERVECLSRFIFRKKFIDGMGMRRFAFEQVAKTVNQVPLLRVTRPAVAVEPKRLAQQMLDHIATAEAVSVL
ncbi:hypothetical protein QWY75_01250 [Pontixanthobacter aestiaquae]|uniref:Hpr(Ser) kinase/phosphatase n=1 Tax=Pontixanthobacter aestiaquae TaxID=1509367 RepID=A0A844Z6A1_9SPHN|nr:hypothetical protein [Pontixanthobacter aestiaquae]MDN3644826.1 hypothetical protein [Pontixanthobacter aestiaquae]MXO84171.1 hypothetical protein [Pontixanthobacter aestiaquae]